MTRVEKLRNWKGLIQRKNNIGIFLHKREYSFKGSFEYDTNWAKM